MRWASATSLKSEALASNARLPVWAYADQPVYLCGPLPFMQAQWRDLVAAGVPPTRIHREVFGPDLLDHLL